MKFLSGLAFCVLLIYGCRGSQAHRQQDALPDRLKAEALDLEGFTPRSILLINEVGIVNTRLLTSALIKLFIVEHLHLTTL